MKKQPLVLALFVLLAPLGAAVLGCAAERESQEPVVRITQADLDRLPGTYANAEMGYTFEVDLVGSRVRLTMKEGHPQFPPALLVPVSATRFQWKGEGLAPGLIVAFDSTGQRAGSLRVIQPGKPAPVLMRRVQES